MTRLVFCGLLCILCVSRAYAGDFIGKLEFTPVGCEKTRECHLVYDFGYIDSSGVGWQAKANDLTDGATIPSWAQTIIGAPFDNEFIKASTIHDHYCLRNVRTWKQTHWVLYDALLASGVSDVKAKVMYYAVLVGGPKWVSLIPGDPCGIGKNCIQNVSGSLNIPNTRIVIAPDGNKTAYRDSQYKEEWFLSDVDQAKKIIESKSGAMSLEQIVELAKSRHPTDFFFFHGDAIQYIDDTSRFPKQ